MMDFMGIKRVQFPSTEAFINELRRRFRRYSDLGGLPMPYSALAIMLRELGHIPKLDLFILGKEDEVSGVVNPAEAVTVWDFYGCCEEIIGFVKGKMLICLFQRDCVRDRYRLWRRFLRFKVGIGIRWGVRL
jgi:hypothetical protein